MWSFRAHKEPHDAKDCKKTGNGGMDNKARQERHDA